MTLVDGGRSAETRQRRRIVLITVWKKAFSRRPNYHKYSVGLLSFFTLKARQQPMFVGY